MPHAIHFSTGDLARGFVGHVLSHAGFQVTFVGHDEHMVDILRQLGGYTVEVAGASEVREEWVPCDALLQADPEVARRLGSCDLVTVSCGTDQLPTIAQLVADGFRLRKERGVIEPLNVIVVARLVRASTWLRQLVHERLAPEELTFVKAYGSFVDCAWDRIIPSVDANRSLALVSKGSPMHDEVRVIAEDYFEWVVDDKQWRGALPVKGLARRSPLDLFISRLMFLLPAGHVTAAYLGHLRGKEFIVESMAVPDVEKMVRQVMSEVAQTEIPKYGACPQELDQFIETYIARFKNPHIKDTVARVGRDPLRKLAKDERLIKPLLSSIKYGTPNDGLCTAIAAALHYRAAGDPQATHLQQLVFRLGVEGALRMVCGVSRDSPTHAQLNEDAAIVKIRAAYLAMAPADFVRPPSRPESALPLPAQLPRIQTSLSTVRKSAVHFGAGKIGRGFIGLLLALAGYEVTFADVDRRMVGLLNKLQAYDVKVVGAAAVSAVHVRDVGAVLSTDDAVLDKLAACDLVTTAVGVNILPKVAPVIARGIQRRRQRGNDDPLNVIACENAVRATTALKAFVLENLEGADLEYAMQTVGFADSAVDRIVPSMERLPLPDDLPDMAEAQDVEVTVEEFFEWDVDETQMKGGGYFQGVRDIDGVTLCRNLQAFVERKLFTLNTGHATTAYLGYIKKYTYVAESIGDPAIEAIVRAAMHESAAVLIRRYDFDPARHAEYIERILTRFKNPCLQDDVTRVGRDPIRKLGIGDRFFKPLLGTLEYGLPNDHLCQGIAAALRFTNSGDEQAVKLQQMLTDVGVAGALAQILPVAGRKLPDDVLRRITAAYERKVFGDAPSPAAP